MLTIQPPSLAASDCDALAKHGRQSGAHVIYTTGDVAMKVYCDIDEDGGWIVSMSE